MARTLATTQLSICSHFWQCHYYQANRLLQDYFTASGTIGNKHQWCCFHAPENSTALSAPGVNTVLLKFPI